MVNIATVQQSFGIVGKDTKFLQAITSAVMAAPYDDANIMITGENGVGKEVFHKIIHNFSPRKLKKCITVNCGALPEGTVDSELFGHVKGAFTGALTDRKGYFEEANGSTIFLDEIGELPLATQARLLRILESGEYYRVGSSEIRKTNVRVISATNIDLQNAIKEGKFREDLYFRLSTINIEVPPLRERGEDIFLLFRKFAGDVASQYNMPIISLNNEAKRKLLAYHWPGNVRQLLHTVKAISIIEQEREITPEILLRHLPKFDERMIIYDKEQGDLIFNPGEKKMFYHVILEIQQEIAHIKKHLGLNTTYNYTTEYQPKALPAAPKILHDEGLNEEPTDPHSAEATSHSNEMNTDSNGNAEYIEVPGIVIPKEISSSRKTLDDIIKQTIIDSMHKHGGNKKKVAKELGISERTLYRKLTEYNLDDKNFTLNL